MPSRITIAVVLAAVCCGCSDSPRFRETRQSKAAYVVGSPLRVETANGEVVIRQRDGDEVRIEAKLVAGSEDRLRRATVLSERGAEGSLNLSVDWPGGRRDSEGCTFVVLVPDVGSTRVSSTNGQVRVDGLSGPVEIRTTNGDVHVDDHEGAVDVETTNGRVLVDGSPDDVRIETSNGAVIVSNVGGEVAVHSSNATIDVTLADTSPGPVEVETSNGSVLLEVGSEFGGRLVAETTNGSVARSPNVEGRVVDESSGRIEIVVGDSGRPSTVRTTNGTITLSGPR